MKKLTKKHRLEAYKYALENAILRNYTLMRSKYVCSSLFEYYNNKGFDNFDFLSMGEVCRKFKEFYKYKPKCVHLYDSWFKDSERGDMKRIKLLEKIISEMEKPKHNGKKEKNICKGIN